VRIAELELGGPRVGHSRAAGFESSGEVAESLKIKRTLLSGEDSKE
jgi:hypothetical protein